MVRWYQQRKYSKNESQTVFRSDLEALLLYALPLHRARIFSKKRLDQRPKEEMANLEGEFKDRIKDVIYHKDELESHFEKALELAKTKEELLKLKQAVTKTEKELNRMKDAIEKKMDASSPGSGATSTKTAPAPVSSTVPTKLVVPAAASPASGGSSSSTIKVENLFKSVTASGAPGSNGTQQTVPRPQQPQASRVFSNSDWYNFRKNPNIPDSQRIFIPALSPRTTEESLYKFFSAYGTVVDVKLFEFVWTGGGRPNAAAVGFDSAATVNKVLALAFTIDGHTTTVRPYYSKEEPAYRPKHKYPPSTLKLKRFQVFCGGIPARATLADIEAAISDFGKIRGIRLAYHKGGNPEFHRGFAFIDMEEEEDAQYLVSKVEDVYILGKKVDCKANTSPLPDDEDASLSGSLADLTDVGEALPSSMAKPYQAARPPAQSSGVVSVKVQGSKAELCIICKKNQQNCVLLWCGHTDTCKECGDKLQHCPHIGCNDIIANRVLLAS